MLASDLNKRKLRPRLKVVSTKYSQSTPTTTHVYQEDSDSPYSPANSSSSFMSSVSGIAEKSASELGSLLKNAYKSLREKEKNLLLAAEIGKSLLEHNQNLKSDYDKLLQNAKNCQFHTRHDNQEYENNMRLISSKKAYDAIIESLERKNQDLEHMLENTQQHSELTNQTNLQKQRKLEVEIEILKNNLDLAAQKVQDLEESRQFQQERAKQLDERRDYEQQQNEDLELLEELTIKMEELFIENKHLQLSKKAVEEKLVISLRDLDSLRHDFENFELTNQCYEQLQEAFERQTIHIRELNDSLEDHRLVLSRLRDKGLWSPQQSSTPSVSGHHSVFSTCVSKQSLMGELENAWSKNCLTKSKSDSNLSTLSSKLFDLASMTERNLTSFYTAPADYALGTILSTMGVDDRSMLDEAEHFLAASTTSTDDLFGPEGNTSLYKEVDLYPSYRSLPSLKTISTKLQYEDQPKKGLINHILFQIRYVFRSIFRWCRFAIILTTAIFINLWKGPDLLLDKQ
ncbi:hypothetical protein MAM1_0603d10998 [Mucor ambiguus]|uniref:Uncharacterized protein n=1 Tax=Mucor ambiguus TaxID=91626 RepID=A0A0C9LYX3_9FUNG|nr:hypothetical protein MAM1_0603d10998 [Mucor ambiguus]